MSELNVGAGTHRDRRWRALYRSVALVWGFAEATLFFVIPDVWITRVALRSRREGLEAAAYATVGAIAGGALTYLWAAREPATVRAIFDALPAISPALMDSIGARWEQLGLWAPLAGAFSGVPYKLYAAQACNVVSLPLFLLLSVAARGARFVAFALVAHLAARWATPRVGVRKVFIVWLVLWAVGYMLYWLHMPN